MNATLQTVLYNPLSWNGDVDFWLIKGTSFHKQAQKTSYMWLYSTAARSDKSLYIFDKYGVNMGLIFS